MAPLARPAARHCAPQPGFHWQIGAFDETRGKLRETYSTAGTHAICDSYVDNGHPYWGMQAFAFYLIGPRDPFWTAAEEPLPVERGDFRVRFHSLKMMLTGVQKSGQVRWLQAATFRGGADYRDKYTKFSYSSLFPFNLIKDKDKIAGDAALVFRDPATGEVAARAGIKRGDLIANGVELEWWTVLEKNRIEVVSRIEVVGDLEKRTHTVTTPVAVEALEGSYPLAVEEGEEPARDLIANWSSITSRAGRRIESRTMAGFERIDVTPSPGNIISARTVVQILYGKLKPGRTVLISHHESA